MGQPPPSGYGKNYGFNHLSYLEGFLHRKKSRKNKSIEGAKKC